MNIGLIIIGDEILSGKRQDKHMAKVLDLLSSRGLQLSWVEYLGDDRPRITRSLERALASGDLVFSCGGIGATPDDHTRQAAAAASGRALVLHPQARDLIVERMQDVAREKGEPFEPERPDNLHRLHMGTFPEGATIIPNPYNKIPGFSLGDVHFVPGFPVMAWPMIESLLDQRYAHLHGRQVSRERSLIVFEAMESALSPLMERLEADYPDIKVFSLPSVDHPQYGRHIELGVKGAGDLSQPFEALRAGLQDLGASLGPELVR